MGATPFFLLCLFPIILVTRVATYVEELDEVHFPHLVPVQPGYVAHFVYHSNPSPASSKTFRYPCIFLASSFILTFTSGFFTFSFISLIWSPK